MVIVAFKVLMRATRQVVVVLLALEVAIGLTEALLTQNVLRCHVAPHFPEPKNGRGARLGLDPFTSPSPRPSCSSLGALPWTIIPPQSLATRYGSYFNRLWRETSKKSRDSMDRKKLTKAIATLERQLEGQAIEFRDEELVVSLREYLDKAHKQLEAKSAEVVPKRPKGGTAAAVAKKVSSNSMNPAQPFPTLIRLVPLVVAVPISPLWGSHGCRRCLLGILRKLHLYVPFHAHGHPRPA